MVLKSTELHIKGSEPEGAATISGYLKTPGNAIILLS
jgi:hypothetical protein